MPSVSYALATAAANLPLARGQRIVTLADQFPSNVYAWRELAAREGGEVVAVERPSQDDWTGAVLEAIDERTAGYRTITGPTGAWSTVAVGGDVARSEQHWF